MAQIAYSVYLRQSALRCRCRCDKISKHPLSWIWLHFVVLLTSDIGFLQTDLSSPVYAEQLKDFFYQSLSYFRRALRYHYRRSRNHELIPVPNKLIYQFSKDFMTKYVQTLGFKSSNWSWSIPGGRSLSILSLFHMHIIKRDKNIPSGKM